MELSKFVFYDYNYKYEEYIDWLVPDCSIFSALEIDILWFGTKPSIYASPRKATVGSNTGWSLAYGWLHREHCYQ